MPAIEILGLEKIYTVGFWRKKPKHGPAPVARWRSMKAKSSAISDRTAPAKPRLSNC